MTSSGEITPVSRNCGGKLLRVEYQSRLFILDWTKATDLRCSDEQYLNTIVLFKYLF